MFERTPLPRYAQVADALRNRIRRGAWERGEAIPTIDRLMAEFGVGRVTVRQAIQVLAHEGLLSPQQGRGTFVTADAGSQRRLHVETSLAELAGVYRGDAPDVEHIIETDEAPRLTAEDGRPAAEGYVHMRRVHSREGERYCLVSIYLARPVFDLAPARFRRELVIPLLLELPGVVIVGGRQTLDIGAADVDAARSLGLAVNAPVAEVRCSFVAPDGTVIYFAEASHRGDYIHLEMDLLQTTRTAR
jgi:GntR family transcriptional regulator